MFGTGIHWTTFFFVLIDTCIILIVLFNRKIAINKKRFNRFLILSILYIIFNLTEGFLPSEDLPGARSIQYITRYGVAITLCLYIIYYIYQDFEVNALKTWWTVSNLILIVIGCFLVLFLLPYLITNSIEIARKVFAIPIAFIAFFILFSFYKRLSGILNNNYVNQRRKHSSLIMLSSITLLPVFTVIWNYQWLTSTVMNLGFLAIIYMEITYYLFRLANKRRISAFYDQWAIVNAEGYFSRLKIAGQTLTPRQKEVALLILEGLPYKEIGKSLNIAEKTVSKHASNIFRRTHVKNREQFLEKFKTN